VVRMAPEAANPGCSPCKPGVNHQSRAHTAPGMSVKSRLVLWLEQWKHLRGGRRNASLCVKK